VNEEIARVNSRLKPDDFQYLGLLPFLSRSQRNFISFEPPRYRPRVIVAGGSGFFLYFSYTELGGVIPAACLGIFLWESMLDASRWFPDADRFGDALA
jgi:hypothetical protein